MLTLPGSVSLYFDHIFNALVRKYIWLMRRQSQSHFLSLSINVLIAADQLHLVIQSLSLSLSLSFTHLLGKILKTWLSLHENLQQSRKFQRI